MAKKPTVRMDITGLKVMQSALQKIEDGAHHIQVGVFGEKAMRKDTADTGLTNAEVGIIQEMGSHTRGIPRRSFLWDTLAHRGQQLMASLGPDTLSLFKTGKVDEYLKRCGVAAENLVKEAFHTSGWGAWPPNSYATLLAKLRGSLHSRRQQAAEVVYEGADHAKPLVDSGQLWQSVASRVTKA